MISNTTDLVESRVRRLRHWPKISADRLLSLAAAPTFAIMALLTLAGGSPDMICSASQGVSPLSGMVPMYLPMSAFHLAPWLRLFSGGRGGASPRKK